MVKKIKPCYMGTDSFIDHVETDYINKNIAEEVETRFDTSNYELNKPVLKRKNKKVIDLVWSGMQIRLYVSSSM